MKYNAIIDITLLYTQNMYFGMLNSNLRSPGWNILFYLQCVLYIVPEVFLPL